MMSKFFTAKNDKVFKAIFSDPSDTELLETLLSLIFKKKVSNITFSNTELLKRNVVERAKIVDFIATVDGVKTHIEMNSSDQSWLHLRNLNFFSTIFSKETEVGDAYDVNTKFLHIDFTYGLKESKRLPRVIEYKIQSDEKIKYVSNITMLEYNMDKIKRTWYNVIDEHERKLYQYLSILDADKEDLEEMEKDEYMKKYQEKVEKLNENKEFTSFLTHEQDIRFQLNSERLEGKREGEKNKQLEIARKMLRKYDIKEISEITGLSIAAIQELQKN